MRGRMADVKSYVPPFRLGEPLEGGAVGTVVESRSPALAVGDLVLHMLGWRDEAVLPARHAQKVAAVPGLSPSAYLGVLGMPALTAYVGQHRQDDRPALTSDWPGTLWLVAEFALDHRD
jgi:NADPH-dependent curcumin reductase CurA